MSKNPKVVVVLGPNASGKSDLGVLLARKFNGEIISADSRQVYRGLNLGTGKITRREMQGITHHLIDVIAPRRNFNVARYQKLGKEAIKKILKRGKLPIIVGGTGLYVDTLIYDYPLPPVKPNPSLRKKLEKLSAETLFARLRKLDPKRAENIDRHNRRRLIRALEILSEQPIPQATAVLIKKSPYEVLKIGIKKNPEDLRELIHKRLVKRIRQGLVQEVENLLKDKALSHAHLESLGLEYRYISRYLRGEMRKDEMIQKLETKIWHYAKRQMTWWRHDKEIIWIENKSQAVALIKNSL
jgi:tRNA dimethylallyltransferase